MAHAIPPVDFEPRPFQKGVLEQISKDKVHPLQFRRGRTYIGVDLAEKGGDRTVVSRAKINGKGQITSIVFDEFGTFPDYKWYKNPIKWYQWKKLWKAVERNMPNEKIR